MAHEGSLISWNAIADAGRDGRLMELLERLPRARWAERDPYGKTLLHHACFGPNVAAVVALLQSGLVDVNARTGWGYMPARFAVANKQPRVLEVLCAAGADLRASEDGHCPIDVALGSSKQNGSAHVLVANGVRLSTVHEQFRRYITPELEAFERGVLRCREAVVAMLRVKWAGKLWMWDKFLLVELALGAWATRYDKGWQTAAQQ